MKRQYKNYPHYLDYTKTGRDISTIVLGVSAVIAAIAFAIFMAVK